MHDGRNFERTRNPEHLDAGFLHAVLCEAFDRCRAQSLGQRLVEAAHNNADGQAVAIQASSGLFHCTEVRRRDFTVLTYPLFVHHSPSVIGH